MSFENERDELYLIEAALDSQQNPTTRSHSQAITSYSASSLPAWLYTSADLTIPHYRLSPIIIQLPISEQLRLFLTPISPEVFISYNTILREGYRLMNRLARRWPRELGSAHIKMCKIPFHAAFYKLHTTLTVKVYRRQIWLSITANPNDSYSASRIRA